jgi:hypothetical protein
VRRRGRGRAVPDRAPLRPGQREHGRQHGTAPELAARHADTPGQPEHHADADADAQPGGEAPGAESERQPEAGQVSIVTVPQELIADQLLLGEQLIEPDGHGVAVRDTSVLFASVDIAVRH